MHSNNKAYFLLFISMGTVVEHLCRLQVLGVHYPFQCIFTTADLMKTHLI